MKDYKFLSGELEKITKKLARLSYLRSKNNELKRLHSAECSDFNEQIKQLIIFLQRHQTNPRAMELLYSLTTFSKTPTAEDNFFAVKLEQINEALIKNKNMLSGMEMNSKGVI